LAGVENDVVSKPFAVDTGGLWPSTPKSRVLDRMISIRCSVSSLYKTKKGHRDLKFQT